MMNGAVWEYGQNLEVDGITKAAQAILQRIKESQNDRQRSNYRNLGSSKEKSP